MISLACGGRCVLYTCPQANKKFSCLLFTRVRAAWRLRRQQVRSPERWGSLRGHSTLERPALRSASRRRRLFVLLFLNYFL